MKRIVNLSLSSALILFVLLFSTNLFSQNTVKGTVTSGDNAAEGISVQVKGLPENVVTTDQNGMFAIEVADAKNDVLIFSQEGMTVLELPVGGKENFAIDIKNDQDTNQYGIRVFSVPLQAKANNGILSLESSDKKFKFWLDNRVYFDGAWFLGDPLNPIGNGYNIRRARFAVKSILWEKWYGEIDLDFAGSAVELKDAYLKYMFKDGFLKAGNFKEAFSMETTTTSRYTTFIERSLPSEFGPSRHLGVSASKWGTHWLAIAGVHFNIVSDFEEVTFTLDNNKDFGVDEGISYTGRLAFMPIQKQHKVLHLGVAGSYRTPKTHEEIIDGYRFSTRSLSSINRKKYIDTDFLRDVDHRILMGAELAGAYNSFMFHGEYMTNTVYGKDDTYTAHMNGGFIQAAWLIFGSKYNYNNEEGEFTQSSFKNDWGELELAVRYSYVNANDKEANVFGGSGESYTIGLNYYPNTNVKLMLNYNYLNHDRYANGKGKLYIYKDEAGNLYKDITDLNVPAGEAGEDFGFISARIEVDF